MSFVKNSLKKSSSFLSFFSTPTVNVSNKNMEHQVVLLGLNPMTQL